MWFLAYALQGVTREGIEGMSCQNRYGSRYLGVYIPALRLDQNPNFNLPNVALFHGIRLRMCL